MPRATILFDRDFIMSLPPSPRYAALLTEQQAALLLSLTDIMVNRNYWTEMSDIDWQIAEGRIGAMLEQLLDIPD